MNRLGSRDRGDVLFVTDAAHLFARGRLLEMFD
jgi:hypothetical protein